MTQMTQSQPAAAQARTAVGWHVEIEFEEDDHRTRAAALLRLPDGNEVRAHGYASRHPSDSNQPRVGEEVAGARAAQRTGDEAVDQGARRDRRGVGKDLASAEVSHLS
jgi:Domain of unknown function (DUF1876).